MIRLTGREARRVASYSKAEWNIVQMLEMLYRGFEEAGYRRLRCTQCGFEDDRDVVGKLNIGKGR
jgi:predicted Zn-ribbon and HTH transcriptional regulator